MCFDCEPVAINMSTIFAQTFVLCQPSLHGPCGDGMSFVKKQTITKGIGVTLWDSFQQFFIT